MDGISKMFLSLDLMVKKNISLKFNKIKLKYIVRKNSYFSVTVFLVFVFSNDFDANVEEYKETQNGVMYVNTILKIFLNIKLLSKITS